MAYYNNSDNPVISIPDTDWIHDFRSLLFTLNNIFYYDKKYLYEYDEDLKMTMLEFYEKQGLTDINNVMLFFDRYIGYIHRFIETGEFNKIAACRYEKYLPGWYIKHMSDYEKIDGEWKWV